MRGVALVAGLSLMLFGGCLCGVPDDLAFCGADSDCDVAERCDDGRCVATEAVVDAGVVCTPATSCPAQFCGSFDAGCGAALACACTNGEQCGASGLPNVCAVCDPSQPDSPDDAFLDTNCDGIDGTLDASVFVSPQGLDDADGGGPTAPFRTIAFALTQAAQRPVLLDQGDYPSGGVIISKPVSIFGGYRADAGWSRELTFASVLRVSATGLRVEAVDGSVVLDRMQIVGDDSDGGAGGFAGALFITASSNVRVRNAVVEAGRGFVGAAGSIGANGANGSDGGDGQPGSNSGGAAGAGGAPGVNLACTGASGGQGGNGGLGNDLINQNPGAPGGNNGTATLIGGAGGAAACTTCACRNGDGGTGLSVGGSSANGGPGLEGSGFGVLLPADGGSYSPTIAGDGVRGVHGQGGSAGGGGASAYVAVAGACAANQTPTGGGGAGAGAGGCGGGPGRGGTGGGPSIAIINFDSAVTVESATLATRGGGNGGEGGRGGFGGQGGVGGRGGAGGVAAGAIAGNGGPGGRGSNGGVGGPGGGGAGGYSLGVYCEGPAASVQLRDAGTQLGPGGSGGISTGVVGRNGQVAATLGCP